MPVLDLGMLSHSQLSTVNVVLKEFRAKDLQPAYLAYPNPNRALLGRRVLCDLLGFENDFYQAVPRLSAKRRAEPSVHGGKQRPVGTELVVYTAVSRCIDYVGSIGSCGLGAKFLFTRVV